MGAEERVRVALTVHGCRLDLDYQIDASTIVSDMENFNFSVSFIDELKNLSEYHSI